MGKTYAILGNKRDAKTLNYELVKGKNVTWKPKQSRDRGLPRDKYRYLIKGDLL